MHTNERIDEQHKGELANLSTYYLHARPEVLELIPKTAHRMLDVGCGGGGLSAAIKARQPAEIHGVELVEEAADRARRHLDKVWNSDIETALPQLPDGYYDCIVIADVLEHLIDPLNVLLKLVKKLAANGKLIASIPNIQNWDVLSELLQGKWDYRSEGILDRTHLRFFTRKSAQELFWSAGLRILRLSTTRRGTPPPTSFIKALKRIGLSERELISDGETFQFLIEAEVPDRSLEPKVAVVVLNWNGKPDTLECIASLQKLDYSNFEIVVVDNASTDDSIDAIRTKYPDITILETGANLGYAGGNNVGIRWALNHNAEYVLVLNNDTAVDSRLLNAFVEAASVAPRAGIYGAKIYFYDRPDTLWFAGGRWRHHELSFEHVGKGQKDSEEYSSFREWDYVTGCALFASASVFSDIGLLNEDFFLTYEETDWCYRARAGGYRCVVVPDATLWHKVSASFGGGNSPLLTYFMVRNKLLWAQKHCSRIEFRAVKREARQIGLTILLPPFVFSNGASSLAKRFVWSCTTWIRSVRSRLSYPANIATLYALRDFYFRRFGDCPAAVRELTRSKSTLSTENIAPAQEERHAK